MVKAYSDPRFGEQVLVYRAVGSRPCTPDGLPLIGATSSPRVFAAGGHGMWGIALGPVTGRLLSERIVTGNTPPELVAFDPLR